MTDEPATLRAVVDELRAVVDELLVAYDDNRTTESLLARLRDLFVPGTATGADPTGRKPKGGKGGNVRDSGSRGALGRAPVDASSFELVLEVEAGSRRLEAQLRAALGFGQRRRPMTSEASLEALRALPVLVDALPAAHQLRDDVYRAVGGWHRQARTVTGHRERWPRVTRLYDVEEKTLVKATCPFCGAESLRQRPDDVVVCCAPRCRDDEGHRPRWTPERLKLLGLVLRHEQLEPAIAVAQAEEAAEQRQAAAS